jgi:hypothetical protein|nr:MAG TPA: tail assembly chaperone protein [Caudoviricetes sp.]
MKLNLKFNARNINEIEKIKGMPINNCLGDISIGNLALFVEKGLDKKDMTLEKAFDEIDEYLKENDLNELMFDVMEALIDAGFLSRKVNMKEMRKQQEEIYKNLIK